MTCLYGKFLQKGATDRLARLLDLQDEPKLREAYISGGVVRSRHKDGSLLVVFLITEGFLVSMARRTKSYQKSAGWG